MTAHEMVAKSRNLPRVSEAALRLADMLDEFGDNKEAIELIKSDALLTAKLLRLCNSSALALAEQVSSVDHAILLLGHNQVLNLVLSLAFGNAMTRPMPGGVIEINGLWRHAFMSATAAEAIVNRGRYLEAEPSVAFTAGLLHDVGKLVMAQALTSEVQSALQKQMPGNTFGSIEIEREMTGTDHAEVGACLLHVWRLPDAIIEAVANHHRPTLKPEPHLSAVAHVANRLAHLAEAKPNSEAYAFGENEEVVQAFDLNAQEREELVSIVRKSASRSEELLKIA